MPEATQDEPDSADIAIYVAGLGMRSGHLTPETVEALEVSSTVLYVSHIPGTQDLISHSCDRLVDLTPLYAEHADRLTTYQHMAAAVLDAAIADPPVTLLMYGHPTFLSLPSQIVARTAAQLGLTTRTLPAVSSLDCLAADLGVDLVSTGVQMHEATDLVECGRPLVPQLATVLWQVGTLFSHTYDIAARPSAEPLARLRDHLLKYFEPTHQVVAISSSVDKGATLAETHRFALSTLTDHSDVLHPGVTLYVPPLAADPSS